MWLTDFEVDNISSPFYFCVVWLSERFSRPGWVLLSLESRVWVSTPVLALPCLFIRQIEVAIYCYCLILNHCYFKVFISLVNGSVFSESELIYVFICIWFFDHPYLSIFLSLGCGAFCDEFSCWRNVWCSDECLIIRILGYVYPMPFYSIHIHIFAWLCFKLKHFFPSFPCSYS